MTFLQIISLAAQLLGFAHDAVTTLGPLFPNAHQGLSKADAVIQTATALVPHTGIPDEHVAALTAALPIVAGAITAGRAVAASFQDQQTASAGA